LSRSTSEKALLLRWAAASGGERRDKENGSPRIVPLVTNTTT